MSHIAIILLSVLSLSLSSTTQNIEKAFLQNNPKLLLDLLPSEAHINISIPDPVSFSDYVSNHQAYFLFKKLFSIYSTFQFYSERQPDQRLRRNVIYKARWSFRDRRSDTQYVYNIFFYLTFAGSGSSKTRPPSWRISEIRVEKS